MFILYTCYNKKKLNIVDIFDIIFRSKQSMQYRSKPVRFQQ